MRGWDAVFYQMAASCLICTQGAALLAMANYSSRWALWKKECKGREYELCDVIRQRDTVLKYCCDNYFGTPSVVNTDAVCQFCLFKFGLGSLFLRLKCGKYVHKNCMKSYATTTVGEAIAHELRSIDYEDFRKASVRGFLCLCGGPFTIVGQGRSLEGFHKSDADYIIIEHEFLRFGQPLFPDFIAQRRSLGKITPRPNEGLASLVHIFGCADFAFCLVQPASPMSRSFYVGVFKNKPRDPPLVELDMPIHEVMINISGCYVCDMTKMYYQLDHRSYNGIHVHVSPDIALPTSVSLSPTNHVVTSTISELISCVFALYGLGDSMRLYKGRGEENSLHSVFATISDLRQVYCGKQR